MENFYKNKTILITGAAGTIGSALVGKILEYGPKIIRALDINETGLFTLKQGLPREKIRLLIGDIRDKTRLVRAVEDVDIVLHAAALKHVPLCEFNPFEAVQTNVLGTKNLIEAAMDEKIEKFITISTDKAVNPVNVLGASKLLAERLTVSANLYKGDRVTTFSCVRFGNVLNSQGSVAPIFVSQIKKGGPVQVTDEGMTRFVLSIDKAIELVLKASCMSKGGEIFILKMHAIRIKDLALAMIKEMAPRYGHKPDDIKIGFVGKRNGEKMYEELMSEDEAQVMQENDDMFVISPGGAKNNNGYHSKLYKSREADLMEVEKIRELVRDVYK